MACAAAAYNWRIVAERVLLVSTDPASNLDDVLGVTLGNSATPVEVTANLLAMNNQIRKQPPTNIVSEWSALTAASCLKLPIKSMEEQFSGSCTLEIAAFDEFSRLLGDRAATNGFDSRHFRYRSDRPHVAAIDPAPRRGLVLWNRTRPERHVSDHWRDCNRNSRSTHKRYTR